MKSGTYHVDLSLPTEGGTITLITAEGIEFATMNYKRQRAGVSEGLLPDGVPAHEVHARRHSGCAKHCPGF